MPILIFLRQYGPREYLITLAVAALVGLGIAVLLNSASGGDPGAPALLKTKAQLAASSSRLLTTHVYKTPPAPAPAPVRHHARARRHHVRHVRHISPAPAPVVASPAPKLVAVRTPTPVVRPVVRAPSPPRVIQRPAPRPRPAPAPKRTSGGGLQFDDSG
jgi:hypothetical protein